TQTASLAAETKPSASEAGLYERWAHAGREGKGANLDAPADPARPYPARPEWYFLFLFQLLKYFEGEQEIIGTVVIPVGAGVVLRRDPENQGHELFKQNCASCHSHGDAIRNDRATAADLAGFGTREWIVGLLTNPHDPRYLARTKLKAMTGWLEREHAAAKKKGKEKDLQDQFALIATWLAGH